MPFSRPGALRAELARALPDRPFRARLWDGSELPPTTDGRAVPTFTARSPRAITHLLRAPGQLGLARAYVSGELEADDLDAVAALLLTWSPPALDGAAKRRLALAAVRAAGLQPPPPVPRPSCARRVCAIRCAATRGPCATTTTSRTRSSR